MRGIARAALVVALTLAAGACTPTATRGPEGSAAGEKVDCEATARRLVSAYVRHEHVDVSDLEFYHARCQDLTGKQSTFAGEFGPKVWIVKYGRARGPDGRMAAGSGLLFYVDSRSGDVIMLRERD